MPSTSPSRWRRVVAETASSSWGNCASRRLISVPFPAPDWPVTTKTGRLEPRSVAVEEANQLRALSVRKSADRLRLADAALVEEPCRLHAPELRYRHQDVEHLRGLDVVGRLAEDLLHPHVSVFQILLQLRPADADVVRTLQRLHPLIARPGGGLGLGLRRGH